MASEHLNKLTKCLDFTLGHLEVCAQDAYTVRILYADFRVYNFQEKLRDVAIEALELIMKQREASSKMVFQ